MSNATPQPTPHVPPNFKLIPFLLISPLISLPTPAFKEPLTSRLTPPILAPIVFFHSIKYTPASIPPFKLKFFKLASAFPPISALPWAIEVLYETPPMPTEAPASTRVTPADAEIPLPELFSLVI